MTAQPAGHLVLRADATGEIGTGHAMRLLALAQAWRDLGGTATWLMAAAPDWIADRYRREGIEVEAIPAPHPDPGDASAVVAAMTTSSQPGASVVGVVDGPSFDEAYLDALGPVAARLLVVDDIAGLARYPVGAVLNQNAHADRAAYPAESSARFLLGLRHALLRREFAREAARRAVPARARRILLTFGGSDPTGMTERSIEALAGLAERGEDLEVVAIVGATNASADRLAAVAAARAPLAARLDRNVDDMTSRMTWADLAVTSAGSTVWELARSGCPALVIETAPAEPHLAAGIREVGLFDALGPAEELGPADLGAAIGRRLGDAAWRTEMAGLGPRLVDGRGALRVAAVLSEISLGAGPAARGGPAAREAAP